MRLDALCDVPGIKVGHAQNLEARTGCTVVIPEKPAVTGVDVRGSAPGTREIELLKPVRLVREIHALLLTGGSAFGLDAAGGVQQFLEERKIGFSTGHAHVPIVPAAVIYDLGIGRSDVRPDRRMGYEAAKNTHAYDQTNGAFGVGSGASIGKIAGFENASPGGVGQASERLGKDVFVAALTVVNPFGDVIDSFTGDVLAGAKSADGRFLDTMLTLKKEGAPVRGGWENTVLSVVATNAKLTKEEATKVAQTAQDGLARSINPAHTIFDGDVVFAMSCGDAKSDILTIGAVAAEVVSRSIEKAVKAAK